MLTITRWACLAAGLCLAACSETSDPLSYQLSHSGDHWDAVPGRDFIPELEQRYPEYFQVILDPSDTREPDLRLLRDDLERNPSDARSYDALHALAVGYFELNYRANARPGGPTYLSDNFRAAKLVAVPWRAYGQKSTTPRCATPSSISSRTRGSARSWAPRQTAPRLARVVASSGVEGETGHRASRAHPRALRPPRSPPACGL